MGTGGETSALDDVVPKPRSRLVAVIVGALAIAIVGSIVMWRNGPSAPADPPHAAEPKLDVLPNAGVPSRSTARGSADTPDPAAADRHVSAPPSAPSASASASRAIGRAIGPKTLPAPIRKRATEDPIGSVEPPMAVSPPSAAATAPVSKPDPLTMDMK
jgi:hypothetical protein